MRRIPLNYYSMDDLRLDIRLAGKRLLVPIYDIDTIKDNVYKEFEAQHPMPNLLSKRYEVSAQVSDDFGIVESDEFSLIEGESLVDLSKIMSIEEFEAGVLDIPNGVKSIFQYENAATENDLERYLSDGIEDYSGNKAIQGTTEYNKSMIKSDEDIESGNIINNVYDDDEDGIDLTSGIEDSVGESNFGGVKTRAEGGISFDFGTLDFDEDAIDIGSEKRQGYLESIVSPVPLKALLVVRKSKQIQKQPVFRELEYDYEELIGGIDAIEPNIDIDYDSLKFMDTFATYQSVVTSVCVEKFEATDIDSSELNTVYLVPEIPDIREYGEDDEGYGSYEEDEGYENYEEELVEESDGDYSDSDYFDEDYEGYEEEPVDESNNYCEDDEGYENYEEEPVNESDNYYEDDEGYENYEEEPVDESDSDYSDSDYEGYEEEPVSDEEPLIDNEPHEIINESHNGVPTEEVVASSTNTVADIPETSMNSDITSPLTDNKIDNTESANSVESMIEEEPKDLRQFLRKHPRCEVSFALKYFSKKELEKAIMLGKVVKRGTKLHI